MFTGIIEEIGRLGPWRRGEQTCRVQVQCSTVLEGTRIGDSIAVDGVCLTVAELEKDSFSADIMVESLRRTAFSGLEAGAPVNLERAVALGGRMGGHLVTGHIDGVGRIRTITRERNSLWYELELCSEVVPFVIPKGSLAVDGISLTVAAVSGQHCSVSLIPHSAASTSLGHKRAGAAINLEADILGKYIWYLTQRSHETTAGEGLTEGRLQELGFI